jgi:hypothetical protein
MKRDADWIEMFGADDLEPLQKEVPALALDDPFFLEQVTGGRSAEQVVDDSFIKELSGCDWQPVTTPKAAPLAEFVKHAAPRFQELQKAAPRRRKAIRAIFESYLRPVFGDANLEPLVEHGLDFVNQSILMEA